MATTNQTRRRKTCGLKKKCHSRHDAKRTYKRRKHRGG